MPPKPSKKHILQSRIWMDVKKSVGNKVSKFEGGWMQFTKLPFINKNLGYIPRIEASKINLERLRDLGLEHNAVAIVIEPSSIKNEKASFLDNLAKHNNLKSTKGAQLEQNILIDLSKGSIELNQNISRKNRYNIRYAKKKGITVEFLDDDNAFNEFVKLYNDTKKRHDFFGRDESYLRKVWKTFKKYERNESKTYKKIVLTKYKQEPLVASFLFLYNNVIYYAYTGSSNNYKKFKPTYLHVWSILEWGSENNFKEFDFMGIENEDNGFSSFKKRFGGNEVQYDNAYELVVDGKYYPIYKIMRNLREKLRFLKKIKY